MNPQLAEQLRNSMERFTEPWRCRQGWRGGHTGAGTSGGS